MVCQKCSTKITIWYSINRIPRYRIPGKPTISKLYKAKIWWEMISINKFLTKILLTDYRQLGAEGISNQDEGWRSCSRKQSNFEGSPNNRPFELVLPPTSSFILNEIRETLKMMPSDKTRKPSAHYNSSRVWKYKFIAMDKNWIKMEIINNPHKVQHIIRIQHMGQEASWIRHLKSLIPNAKVGRRMSSFLDH